MALWPTTPDTNGNVAWTNGGRNLYRNANCVYFLPSENEWYKAAYYDPAKNGGSGGYWKYPTGSDSAPTAVGSGTNPGTAVYNQSFRVGPASVFQAGGLSPYGTMGQGGNVWSWTETSWSIPNTIFQEVRVLRGGDCFCDAYCLQSSFGHGAGSAPDWGDRNCGFRVARKP
jgi:formylglycine-generating enzyme required for sulfatase activity